MYLEKFGRWVPLFIPKEVKASVVNHQYVVYHFSCVGYTTRHLFQRVARQKCSANGKHITKVHCGGDLLNEGCFKVLKKCQSKFDCLVVFEKLYIKRPKPNLNVQMDSMRAKLYGLEFKLFTFL